MKHCGKKLKSSRWSFLIGEFVTDRLWTCCSLCQVKYFLMLLKLVCDRTCNNYSYNTVTLQSLLTQQLVTVKLGIFCCHSPWFTCGSTSHMNVPHLTILFDWSFFIRLKHGLLLFFHFLKAPHMMSTSSIQAGISVSDLHHLPDVL